MITRVVGYLKQGHPGIRYEIIQQESVGVRLISAIRIDCQNCECEEIHRRISLAGHLMCLLEL